MNTTTYKAPQIRIMTIRESIMTDPILNMPEDVDEFIRPIIMDHETEVETAWVICMDNRNRVICYQNLATGTTDTAYIMPREVFRAAIMHSATRVIVVHTHPSGDPTPSRADITVTAKLTHGAELLKIGLIDHVIIGLHSGDFYSLKDHGFIN